MGAFNPDGSWTSNGGKTIGADTPLDQAGLTPEEEAEFNADMAKLGPGGGAPGTQTKFGDVGGVIDDLGGALGLVPSVIDPNAPGASLDTAQADAQRDRLNDFMAALQQQAATGDGAWRQRFRDAVAKTSATSQALGQSSTGAGGDYQSALRNIGNAQGAVSQRAVGEEDMLRSQAQLDARNQLADIYGSQAQMDIGQSAEAARVERERRAANQALLDQSLENRQNTEKGFTSMFGMSDGGRVPGRAQVFGNDERNDTVPAMLSPGEIVIPRDVVMSDDPAGGAARFVAAVKAQGGARGFAGGGETGIRRPTSDEAGGDGMIAAQFLGGPLARTAMFNKLRNTVGGGGGGRLDTTQIDQTHAQQDALAALFAGQAAGSGPSIAPALQQRALDQNIASAMQAQTGGRAPVGDVMQATGAAGVEDSAGVARQAGREQSAGQSAFARAVQQRRAQELQLASAQQQAGFQKTLADAGLMLKNQAALRGALGGAGQGAAAFAGAGGPSERSQRADADLRGERGGFTDISLDDPDFKAFGGIVGGYAGGGEIVARGPSGERLETDRQFIKRRADEQQAYESWADQQEEETDERPTRAQYEARKGRTQKERESAFVRAVRAAGDFAKNASGRLKFAEGGGVTDAGMDPRTLFPYVEPLPPPALPAEPSLWERYNPRALLRGMRDSSIASESAANAEASRAAAPPEAAQRNIAAGPMSLSAGAPGMMGGPPPTSVTTAQDALKTTPGLKTKAQWEAEQKAAKPEASAPAAKPKTGGMGLALAAEQAAADKESRAAIEAQTAADIARSQAEVKGAQAKADAIESAQNERKRIEGLAKQRTDDAMAQYQRAREEMARIDTSVDPGRFWATRTTGDKVLGIIGLALGALGTGPDGINRAAVMLNQAIDRDLDAQKSEHELRLKKGAANVEGAQTFYAMARNAAQDELAATDLARAAALDAAAAKAEALVAQTGEQGAKAQGMKFAASLHQASAQRQASAWEKMLDRNVEWAKVEAAREGREGAAAKELRQAQASATDVLGIVKRLRGNLDTTRALGKSAPIGTQTLVTGAAQKVGPIASSIESDTGQLVLELKELKKMGALDKGAIEIADRIIGDPTAFFALESSKDARLKELEDAVARSVAVRQAGVR